MQSLEINLLKGSVAPRYEAKIKELKIKKAVVTENGMQSNRPLVDLQLEDSLGNKFYAVLSGGLCQNLGAAIDGVNMRNHGSKN